MKLSVKDFTVCRPKRSAIPISQPPDIFAKVKAFLRDILEKLETEAEADATKKAYRDKELAEANQKKEVNSADMEKGPNGIKKTLKTSNDY